MNSMVNSLVFPEERVLRSFFQEDMFKNDNRLKVDIKDLGEKYSLEADLPGLSKEDISVNYNNKILTLKATKKDEIKEENKNERYILRERKSYSFMRQFKVEDILENEIEASFNNGVLQIILPKRKNEVPKEGLNIEIK